MHVSSDSACDIAFTNNIATDWYSIKYAKLASCTARYIMDVREKTH